MRQNNILVFFGIFLVSMLFVPPSMPAVEAQDLPYFGAIVELDKVVYNWTDGVWISVVAPNANSDPNKNDDQTWNVYVKGGREDTGLDVVGWATDVAHRGAGEILLTSMDGDGTRNGYDLGLTRAVSDAVIVPVIASGGVGSLQHLIDGAIDGRADALLAASIFHFGEHTVSEAKQALLDAGVAVRPPATD